MTTHEFALQVCVDLGKRGFLVSMDESAVGITITARPEPPIPDSTFKLTVIKYLPVD